MRSTSDPTERYIAFGRTTIPGAFDEIEARIFNAVNQVHEELAIRGNLLEIGTYFGRSATLLGYFTRGDEVVHVCDPFGGDVDDAVNQMENDSSYSGLTIEKFLANYARFHADPPRVTLGQSASLPGVVEGGSCRFIHIDGSHLYRAVRGDIAMSREFAAPNAVVVVDDIRSAHTPGVSAAAWEAVVNDSLVPVIYSPGKLYATWETNGLLASALEKQLLSLGMRVEAQDLLGHERVLRPVFAPTASSVPQRIARGVTPPVLLKLGHRARLHGRRARNRFMTGRRFGR